MPRQMDFFFYYDSTYTYLTVMRIEEAAARVGIEARWRPFNVRAIMLEQNNIPFRGKPVKMRYMWRDIERRVARYDIPFNRIPTYPVDPESLAKRVGVLSAIEGWCPAYTKATYRAWFLEDKPLGEPENLIPTLQSLGKDPDAVVSHGILRRFETSTRPKLILHGIWASSGHRASLLAARYSGAMIGLRTPLGGVCLSGPHCRRSRATRHLQASITEMPRRGLLRNSPGSSGCLRPSSSRRFAASLGG